MFLPLRLVFNQRPAPEICGIIRLSGPERLILAGVRDAMMTPEQDAFGQCLLAYLQTGAAVEIIERDDGYISTMGPALYFSGPEDWEPHILDALRRARGRVLDVGLGAGRCSLFLQAQGREVVGLDNSPLAVTVARQRGVQATRLLALADVDDTLGMFDTVIMMGNNWGLLGGFESGQAILKRLAQITTPAARIIAETTNPYTTDDPAHLQYHQRNRAQGRMGGQVRFRVRFRQYCGDWMDYLLNSVPEVEQLVAGTGWHLAQTLGDTASHYVLVLEK
jgi:2-polyprenyl-3-methyl-5-hydroxy-6-metoxy-1,4-benzoquinol methylase